MKRNTIDGCRLILCLSLTIGMAALFPSKAVAGSDDNQTKPQFAFRGLGFPVHPYRGPMLLSEGVAVSGNGSAIVGTGRDGLGGSTAFSTNRILGMQAVPPFLGQLSIDTVGTAISGNGRVKAFTYSTGNGALLWQSNGKVQDLGKLGTNFLKILVLSRDGSVAMGNAMPLSQGFRWTKRTGTIALSTLPGHTRGIATAMSDDGKVIVGHSWPTLLGGPPRAFRWTQPGGLQAIPLLPGHNASRAFAISPRGRITVGVSGVYPNLNTVFRYDHRDGSVQDLGWIGPVIGCGGTQCSVLLSPNSIWTLETDLVDVESLMRLAGVLPEGWQALQLKNISADGHVIVGTGVNPAGYFEAFRIRIPSPAQIQEFLSHDIEATATLSSTWQLR